MGARGLNPMVTASSKLSKENSKLGDRIPENSGFALFSRGVRNAKKTAQAPAPATGGGQHSGLYDPKTGSNFEEEIKKRRKNPTGGARAAGGYGGNTDLG